MTEIAFLLTGVLLGALSAWFIARYKFSARLEGDEEMGSLREQNQQLQKEFTVVDKEKAGLQAQLALIIIDRDQKSAELKEERRLLQTAQADLSRAGEIFKNQRERIASLESDYNERFTRQEREFADKETRLKREVEALHQKTALEFENLANKILEDKTRRFTEINRTNLDSVLNPLNEKIRDFGEKVDKIYKSESEERVTLKTEIRHLIELNKQISQEANNLASALKGDNKKQGNWGEFILEQILERSGLMKGKEYETQLATVNMDGDAIRPDVIIYLPDKKHVIVDAKVSLISYEAMVNAATEAERLKFEKEHLSSVKNHIRSLGEKNYHTARNFDTPEFILLFMPVESSFSAAVGAGEDLFSFAWEKRIVLVSPSTLFATLCTIASVWKQERQKNNVMKIAEIGGRLYDQFVKFIDDMKDIDRSLKKAKESYDSAFKRLSSGNGNLVNAADKMKTLGARATRSLDQDLVDEAQES